MGDYSKVMHEEALVARIISQARAIYGPKYPFGSTFDVIYSYHDWYNGYVSWLIVYPQPDSAVLKTGKAVSNDWVSLLKSKRIGSEASALRKTYCDLLEKLCVMMSILWILWEAEEMEKAKAVEVDKSADDD